VAAETGWTAAQTAIVIVAVFAIGGGVISVSITYWLNQRLARRERQAKAFADALAAVEEYAEMPYRIRRRRGGEEARHELTEVISGVQSRLAHHQALLQLEAPDVAAAYAALVTETKKQAGRQMQDAWRQPVLAADEMMNLRERYARDKIDAARGACVTVMRSSLRRIRLGRGTVIPTANSDAPEPPPSPNRDDGGS